ncbi:methyltransferase domain-containing protein [Desulfobacula toluolica]|uniref:Predicted methyltransferase, type 11 n=1 Tax=Desulfobacula toluolica (strain DSM 7467 / Tol2) TaxID=651182 RepID=K0NFB2_DESTT|nr:methyltransferase domain-containing protein [Desulfobacula toluolica]CCK79575.1 predicted methyltransferase, type 11 [Desulfobacula toluolica Tol2]
MIEIDTPGVDIDKIKACIQEELEQYKTVNGGRSFKSIPCPSDFKSAEQWRIDDCVSKETLLQFHGPEFINKAYISILHRKPDFQGKAIYLDKLQNGQLTKIEILGRLRYSREGRLKKVYIKNLLFPFLLKTFFKIPALGWGLRIMAGIFNLPIILMNIQRIENTSIAHYSLMEEKDKNTRTLILKLDEDIQSLKTDSIQARSDLAKEVSLVKTDLLKQIKDNTITLLDMQRRIQTHLEEARKRFPEPISNDQLVHVVKEEDHLFDAMYLSFEDRFRGTENDIKERVKVYLPYVQKACENTKDKSLLDVGCGRGEWLKLLKENNIAAAGLDLNGVMVEKCRDADLDVVQSDLLAYLRNLKADTLSVITGFHIVEHLPFNTMISLFDESLRVLKPGGMVVFETPNPENLMVGACDFYTDPSHKNPIPPHTLSYLVEARGFVNIEIVRLHPNNAIQIEDPFLNYYFTIGQDYAVIGFKE